MAAGTVSIASGAYLYWALSRSAALAWLGSGPGLTYTLGAIAAVCAAIVGGVVNIPTARRLGELAAVQGGSAESDTAQSAVRVKLAARLALGTRVAAALLATAILTMAAARYVS